MHIAAIVIINLIWKLLLYIHKTEAEEQELKEVYTLNSGHRKSGQILNIDESLTMKAAVFFRKDNEKPVLVFIRDLR